MKAEVGCLGGQQSKLKGRGLSGEDTRSEGAIGTHLTGAKSDGNTRSEGAFRTHSAGAQTDSVSAT